MATTGLTQLQEAGATPLIFGVGSASSPAEWSSSGNYVSAAKERIDTMSF